MQLHTYKARSIAEALRLIRQELGPDASVLHTREVGSGLSRWFGGRMIEVTASAEPAAPSRLPALEGGAIPRAELQDFRRKMREDLLGRADAEPSLVEQLASQSPSRPWRQSATCGPLAQRLRQAGVRGEVIERWLERLQAELACDPECHTSHADARLRQIIAGDLPTSGPVRLVSGRSTIVALVGPTGVGKTTTLAKLAADFRLRQERSIGLITTDTYRVAAVEQLRTYAGIMDLPVEVATTTLEMAAAIDRLSDRELVLIDTAGCSPRDAAQLRQLRAVLAAARPSEVLLVLSSVAAKEGLAAAALAFGMAGTTSLILTKLDETSQLGQLSDWLAACRLPLSYITTGQNVPGDLEPASAIQLAKLLLPDLWNATEGVPSRPRLLTPAS
jgi:flagellar biosynthesis protein FlhF